MTSVYAIAAAALVLIGALSAAAVQQLRIDAIDANAKVVRSERDVARAALDVANARIERQARMADVVQRSLSSERTRAVAAERQAADLREAIAKDAGTDRDGSTAPVLRDAVRGLQRTGFVTGSVQMPETGPGACCTDGTLGVDVLHIRDMDPSADDRHVTDRVNELRDRSEKLVEFFNGRRPDRYRVAVIVMGRVERLEIVADKKACNDRVIDEASAIIMRPDYETRLRGHVLVACETIRPERPA